MAGCCWGAPTDRATGLEFPAESVAYLAEPSVRMGEHTIPLHPAALYEALGLFAIFAALLVVRARRGIEPPWRQASRYAIAYGVLRTVTELFRGDASRGFVVELPLPALAEILGLPADHGVALSFSQAGALALAAAGVYGLRRTRAGPASAAG
jgi:prolipoprotein diacylglyceryltransferase